MAGKVKKGASGDVSGIMKKLTNIPGMKAPSLIAKSPTEEGSKLNVVEIKEEESQPNPIGKGNSTDDDLITEELDDEPKEDNKDEDLKILEHPSEE